MLSLPPFLRLISCHEQREILDLRAMSVVTGNQDVMKSEIVIVSWRSVNFNSGFILVDVAQGLHQKDGGRKIVIPDFDYDMDLTMAAQRLLNHVPHASDGSSHHLRETAISIQRVAAGRCLSDERVVVHEVSEEDDQCLLAGNGGLQKIVSRFVQESLPDLQIVVCTGFFVPTQHAKVMITDWITGQKAFLGGSLGALDRFDSRQWL